MEGFFGNPTPLHVSAGRHQPRYLPILGLHFFICGMCISQSSVRIRDKGSKASGRSVNKASHYTFLDQKGESCSVPKFPEGKFQWLVPENLLTSFRFPPKISDKIPADTDMGWHSCILSKYKINANKMPTLQFPSIAYVYSEPYS